MENRQRKTRPQAKKRTVTNKKMAKKSAVKKTTTKKVSSKKPAAKKAPVKKQVQKKYVYYRDAQGNLRRRVVKPKRNYKRLKKIIVVLIAVFFVTLYTITQRDSLALKKLGYSGKERKILMSLSKDEIQEYLSMDHAIDLSIWDEYSNNKHYYDYELYESLNPELAEISVIHYVDSFYDIFNELEILGFTKDYCRDHWDSWTIDQYNVFTDHRIRYDTVEKYLSYDECVIEDLPKYEDSDYSDIEAIMHISYDFVDSNNTVKDKYYVEDCDSEGILLKPGFTVNSYEPSDLVECNVEPDYGYVGASLMTKNAAKNFEKLVKAAKKAGFTIYAQDAYISYNEYDSMFDSLASKYGTVFARTQIGEPGSNEHQTGLAVDITTESYKTDYNMPDIRDSADYKWLLEHACEYGFIVRYPKGKDDITGVQGEFEKPTEKIHLRYVGKEMATDIVDMDMTLEEYILSYGFGYHISYVEDDD